MLAVARALMAEPRLLLMDEPSLGLAPKVVHRLFEQIQEINARGLTILMVEQNARQALKIARYAYLLEVGRLVVEGPSHEIEASEQVQRVYLGG
jgi:branched-chain amino acid transport system ATP-binding protein